MDYYLRLLIRAAIVTSIIKSLLCLTTSDDKEAECHWRSKIAVSLQKTDGTYELVDKIPWDLFCTAYGAYGNCQQTTDGLVPLDPFKNLSLVDENGWYGRNSLHKNEYGRLIPFKTMVNSSDIEAGYGIDGCYGSVPAENLPEERWIALIMRGECKFNVKIDNAARHNATAVIVYTSEQNEVIIMDHDDSGMVTLMISYDAGNHLNLLVHILENVKAHTQYTGAVYINITKVEQACNSDNDNDNFIKLPAKLPPSVTAIIVVFIVLMLLALIILVVYYIQRQRRVTKQVSLDMRLQKAAKKALKKIGEKTITSHDAEVDDEEPQVCTYCLDRFRVGEAIRELPCQHKFHKICVDSWLEANRTCPNCMDDILVSTNTSVKGVDMGVPQVEVAMNGETEMETMGSMDHCPSYIGSYPDVNGSVAGNSQYFGSQAIPGSQLLTDGQGNMFLYVPHDSGIDLDSTVQIDTGMGGVSLSEHTPFELEEEEDYEDDEDQQAAVGEGDEEKEYLVSDSRSSVNSKRV